MDFDWDDANIRHIERHGVDVEEAEDAVLDEYARDFPSHRGPLSQRRFGILGRALTGRVLVVILEERGRKFRVVTARLATSKERKLYEQI